jgi:hypothetical protein
MGEPSAACAIVSRDAGRVMMRFLLGFSLFIVARILQVFERLRGRSHGSFALSGARTRQGSWRSVLAYSETPSAFILVSPPPRARVLLPKRAFTEAHEPAIRELLRTHVHSVVLRDPFKRMQVAVASARARRTGQHSRSP